MDGAVSLKQRSSLKRRLVKKSLENLEDSRRKRWKTGFPGKRLRKSWD